MALTTKHIFGGSIIQSHELRIEALENGGGGGGVNITGLTNPLTEDVEADGNSIYGLNFASMSTLKLDSEGGPMGVLSINGMDGSLMFGYNSQINVLGDLGMGVNSIKFIGNGPDSRIAQGTSGDYLGISLYCQNEYECNWQNGTLTLNGPEDSYGITFGSYGAAIGNVKTITGIDNEDATQAVGTIDISQSTAVDGQLLVIADGYPSGQGNVGVFTYRDNPSGPTEYNFGDGADALAQAINTFFNGTITAAVSNDYTLITLTNQNYGYNGNQSIGNTLAGVVVTGMDGGADSTRVVTVENHLNVYGNLFIDGHTSTDGNIDMQGHDIIGIEKLVAQNGTSGYQATAVITFSAAPNDGETLILTDGTNTVTFTFRDGPSDDTSNFSFAGGEGYDLASKVNNYPNLRITATITGDGQFTFTMDDAGDQGNTKIINNLSNCSGDSRFSGGTDDYRAISFANSDIVDVQSEGAAVIDVSYDGRTLGRRNKLYFVHLQDGSDPSISVNLPDPSYMFGKELQFISNGGGSESFCTLNGNINNNSSANYMFGLLGQAVRFACDGTTWWITNEYPTYTSGSSGIFFATDGNGGDYQINVDNGLINGIYGV